jgi:hypothetical protein
MPIDPTIRQLATDPDIIFTIRAIDCFFEFVAKEKDLDPAFDVGVTTEQMVEEFWKMMKRGFLRLMDGGDDDDTPFVQQTVTPAERAHARVIGATLFAVRQRLRSAAREGIDEASPPRRLSGRLPCNSTPRRSSALRH